MFFLLLSLAEAVRFPLKPFKYSQILTSQTNNTSSRQTIKNYYNQFSFLEIFIGSTNKKFEMLLDTGSNLLWVPDVSCKNCEFSSSYFNISESPESVFIESSNLEILLQTNVTGNTYHDDVRIGGMKVQDFKFMSVVEQSGYSSIPCDGSLGLAFSDRRGNQFNLVDAMKTQGLITEASFSLYLNNNLEDEDFVTSPPATVIFGGFDESLAIEKLHYIRIKRTTGYWMAGLVDIQVDILRDGEITANQEVVLMSSDVVFNTGSPFITFPKPDYEKIMNFIVEDYYCYDSDGINICFCESLDDFPVFRLNIEYKEFEITPQQYVQRDSGFCTIMVVPNNEIDIITLGVPFFLKYYSYFNYDTGKLGLALSAVESQKVVESRTNVLGYAFACAVCVGAALVARKNIKKEVAYQRLE